MQITDKQMKVIYFIQNNLRITFQGTTRQDAIFFISAHIAESKKEATRLRSFLLEERLRHDKAEGRDVDEFFFQ